MDQGYCLKIHLPENLEDIHVGDYSEDVKYTGEENSTYAGWNSRSTPSCKEV